MKTLVDSLPIPALVLSAEGLISLANSRAQAIFGDRIDGRHYITVFRQPALLDAVEKSLTDAVETTAPYLSQDARGDVTLLATCGSLGAGSGVLVCFEDRTAAKAAGQMRRDFVANVSHELRTPLTALLGFIETLRGAAKDDSAARERFLATMEREAQRMNRLVGDLLSLSRVEADERLRPTTLIDLAAVTRGGLGTLAPLAREHGVEIATHGLDEPFHLPGDADQLAQVVTNLVENAIKYSGENTQVEVSLMADPDNRLVRGGALILTVRDQGEGIDPMHIPRLTERFYRIDSHRSRAMGGTGLGLAIVKHIVNRHRGRLRIDSVPGEGSRFSVVLPDSAEGSR